MPYPEGCIFCAHVCVWGGGGGVCVYVRENTVHISTCTVKWTQGTHFGNKLCVCLFVQAIMKTRLCH